MNRIGLYISMIGIFLHTSYSYTQAAQELMRKIQEKKEDLRALILKDNKGEIKKLTSTLIDIKSHEKSAGIPELQEKVRKLRAQACHIQQTDTEIKKYLKKMGALKNELEKTTADDRKKIDALTQKTKSASKEERENLEKRLKSLQEKLTKKAEPSTTQLADLNKKIYDHPKIKKLFDEVKPLMQQIREKYTALTDTLDPLNTSLSDQISAINKNLEKEASAVKKIRESLQELQQRLFEADPCYATKIDLDVQEDWIEFFI